MYIDPLLQPVRPTQIVMDQYGLLDASKGCFGSGISMPKKGSDGMDDSPVRVHARYGVLCEDHHIKYSNKR